MTTPQGPESVEFDANDFKQVEALREKIEGELGFWIGQAVACGFVPEVTLRPTDKLLMGWYSVHLDVRPGILLWRKFFNEYDKKGTST